MEIQVKAEVLRFLAIGYGYGDGYGDGSGFGSGYGYGDGSGSGYGDGDGDGDGYGYGYGDGDGDGDGDGVKVFEGKDVHMVDDIATIIESVHGTYAKGWTLEKDLTLEPCYVAKVGDCFAHGKTLRQAAADAQTKYEQNAPLEERISSFVKQYPQLDSTAKAEDLYRWHGVLTGSCRFGRDQFCKEHGISLADVMTIGRFIELTEKAYGGEAIKQLKEAYR